MRKSRLFMVLSALLCVIAVQAQNIRYVAEGSSGDGTSWDNASGNIQDMIDQLYAYGGGEVWVAAGHYQPEKKIAEFYYHNVQDEMVATGDKDKTFLLKKNVKVYGGFTPGTVDFNDRDWETNETILDGAINDYNVYHVVTVYGDVGSACLDGFTITGGVAESAGEFNNTIIDGYTIFRGRGAGVHSRQSNILLNNLKVEGNTGNIGGGIYSESDIHLRINNTTMQNNNATNGGGIYFRGTSTATLTNIFVRNNNAVTAGSGIELTGNTTISIYGGEIHDNNKHGICSRGTAVIKGVDIYNNINLGVYQPSGTLELENVRVYDNESAGTTGGGMFAQGNTTLNNVHVTGNKGANGAGLYYNGGGFLVMDDCHFSGNESTSGGGGMLVRGNCSEINITNSTFSNNIAGGYGGGIYFYVTEVSAFYSNNVLLSDNTATTRGGGMYIVGANDYFFQNLTVTGNKSDGDGGAIGLNEGSTAVFTNLLAADNAASQGGGINARGGASFQVVNSTIVNNSVTNASRGGGINTGSGTYQVYNSIIHSNGSLNLYPAVDATSFKGTFVNSLVEGVSNASLDDLNADSKNNLDGTSVTIDQLFVDAAEGNYRLLPSTLTDINPALDAGANEWLDNVNYPIEKDLAGNDRIYTGGMADVVDLGPYEYSGVQLLNATYPYQEGVIRSLVLEGVEDPTGADYTYSGQPTTDEAGIYTVNVTGPNGLNKTATLTITNNDVIQFTDGLLLQQEIYDGSPKPLTIASVSNGTLVLDYAPLSGAPTDAGIYEVKVSAMEGASVLGSKTSVLVIEKAVLDIDPSTLVFADNTFTENGNTHSLKIQDEDQLNFDIVYNNNDQVSAGTYTVIAELSHKTDKDNYHTIELSATMTINPRVDTGDPDPVLTYYPVTIETIGDGDVVVSGLNTAGQAAATTTLSVTATPKEGFEFYSIIVSSGRITSELSLENGGSFTVYGETTITVMFMREGFDPNPDPGVGNTVVENDTKLWVADGTLYVRTAQPQALQVVSLTGAVVAQQQVAGEGNISLAKGIYLVRVGKKTEKVIVR